MPPKAQSGNRVRFLHQASSATIVFDKIVKTLTNPAFHGHEAVVVKKVNGKSVVRKAYPPTHRTFTERAIAIENLGGRHPCAVMLLDATQNDDDSVNVEEEFSDGGDLQFYLECIKKKIEYFKDLPVEDRAANKEYVEFRAHQVQFAKAIARQLIEYVFWLETVMRDAPHRNINPKTILLRRNGCIQMKYFDYFTEEMVKENPYHYWKHCIFVAPECSQSLDDRIKNGGFANDIWAIGAVVVAIVTGESYLPEYPRKDPYKVDAGQEPPTQVYVFGSAAAEVKSEPNDTKPTNGEAGNIAADNSSASSNVQQDAQKKRYDRFVTFVAEAELTTWAKLCGDPALAHLVKMCLTPNMKLRPTAAQLLVFMYVAGTTFAQHDYSEPSSTFEERCNLTKIVAEDRAYQFEFGQNVAIGWSMVRAWSQTYDAWCTDIAQLAQGYDTSAGTSLPLAVESEETLARVQGNFGERLYHLLRRYQQQCNGANRMYQHMLNFSIEVLHFKYPTTAEVRNLLNTFICPDLGGMSLHDELRALGNFDIGRTIWRVLLEESDTHYNERNKKIGKYKNKIDTAARTVIDEQRSQVISGRLSCSMIALSQAMFFLKDMYFKRNYPRLLNQVEQSEELAAMEAARNATLAYRMVDIIDLQ